MIRRLPLLALALCALAVPPLSAQDSSAAEENRALQRAASLESRGDYAGAETVLETLLSERPTSTGALFALERVLRAQGRIAEVLGPVRAFLDASPRAAAPRILELQVYAEAGNDRGLQIAAEAWAEADPESSDLYREVARIQAAVLGAEAGIEWLLRGRAALGDPSAYAMEMGDLYRELDRPADAVREWTVAIGEEGSGAAAVVTRLRELPGERSELARPLIETLGAPGSPLPRRRAAARIALDVGLVELAGELAQGVVGDLTGQTRRGFLADLARRADEAQALQLALWSYQRLREAASGGSEARSLDQRIALTALAAGDTALALESQQRVLGALSPGTTERRRALAELTRLVVLRDPEQGEAQLADFRAEFPEAPELDALAVSLASRFQTSGQARRAEAILATIPGPRSLLERGYLQLGQSEVDEGLESLRASLEGLPATEVTRVIGLLDLLERLEEPVRGIVAQSVSLARQGNAATAARALGSGVAQGGWAESPAILALAAHLAEDGEEPEVAAELRAQLIAAHPGATETPEAVLALARWRSRTPEGVPGAVELLQNLILDRPDNPLVPQARRELDRISRMSRGANR